MPSCRAILLLNVSLLAACSAPARLPPALAGGPPGFAAFGEDEDLCRRVGEAAIHDAAAPAADRSQESADASAAHRYDNAYQRCMFEHGRMRQINALAGAEAPGASYGRGNLHSFDYPDAFFSVPYATPGYGYDGFSY